MESKAKFLASRGRSSPNFGFHVDDGVEIRIWDASPETRYLVVPRRPVVIEDLSEEQLASLVTRNGMIGTAPV